MGQSPVIFNPSILFIGNDQERSTLIGWLKSVRLVAVSAASVAEAMQLLLQRQFHFLIVGESLILRRTSAILEVLRVASRASIVVVGSGATDEVTSALRDGADEYVPWSKGPLVLEARLKTLLRRQSNAGSLNDRENFPG